MLLRCGDRPNNITGCSGDKNQERRQRWWWFMYVQRLPEIIRSRGGRNGFDVYNFFSEGPKKEREREKGEGDRGGMCECEVRGE